MILSAMTEAASLAAGRGFRPGRPDSGLMDA